MVLAQPSTLFARFSATVDARQVYSVVGPEGNFLKAVGDSPKGARASPWPLLGTNVPCDGAGSCGFGSVFRGWGSAKREGEPLPSVARMCKSEGAVDLAFQDQELIGFERGVSGAPLVGSNPDIYPQQRSNVGMCPRRHGSECRDFLKTQ